MRLLTKDEWLQGKQNRYKVIRIAGLSQRSKSYLCEDEQNRKFRVKVYDGRNTMYGDTRKRFCKRLDTILHGRPYPVESFDLFYSFIHSLNDEELFILFGSHITFV